MPEVKLKNVVKTFDKGRITAVDHVNLTVQDKEYLTVAWTKRMRKNNYFTYDRWIGVT